MFKVTSYVMVFAPLGVFAAVAFDLWVDEAWRCSLTLGKASSR